MRSALLVPALVATLAAQDPIPLDAPITKVRLQPDEAWITRLGTLEATRSGPLRLSLGGLPPGLTLDDLRITARGPEGTRLGDVTVKREPQPYRDLPEWKLLEAEQAKLNLDLRRLELQDSSQSRSSQLYDQLKDVQNRDLRRRLAREGLKAQAIQDLASAVATRSLELARQSHALGETRGRIVERQQEISKSLNTLRQEAEALPTRVLAELELPRTGAVEVALTYRSRAASWQPAYEARLSSDRSSLELVLFAAVKQDSEQDWRGVELELASQGQGGGLNLPGVPYLPTLSHQEGESPKAAAPASPGPATTQAMASFELPGRVDLKRGELQRFRVTSEDLAPRFRYLAMPRRGSEVFLLALVNPPPGFPLVPGTPIHLLQGSERLGNLNLEPPGPGEPLKLSFGAAPGLTATFAQLSRSREEVGDKAKERQWTLRERVDVSNNLATLSEVEVQDRVIASSTGSIAVDQETDTTPGWQIPQPGLRSWVLRVEPGSRASIDMATRIRGPLVGKLVNAGDLVLEGN